MLRLNSDFDDLLLLQTLRYVKSNAYTVKSDESIRFLEITVTAKVFNGNLLKETYCSNLC